MKKHTQRIVNILKLVIADRDDLKKNGFPSGLDDGVLAYTSKQSIPNITKHDVEGMITELEA